MYERPIVTDAMVMIALEEYMGVPYFALAFHQRGNEFDKMKAALEAVAPEILKKGKNK